MRAPTPGPAIRNRRRPAHALAAAAVFALACAAAALAQGGAPSPDIARAASYLPGFIQYVRWPAEESIAAWQVCAPAQPKSRSAAYDTRPARGKPVTVRELAPGESPAGCQILDLTDASAKSMKTLLAQARRQPILTVGEDTGFCTAGGVVCLRAGDEAGGFEINLTAVQESGLRVNAQLLNLGRKRQTARGTE